MIDYEKLGAFYLGKEFDIRSGQVTDDVVLYDAKDLTTHAVIVGMTGSGKTGLGVTLLEEAAIDGIPALIIDPKGDMGNLLLNFPQLQAEDFRPWVDQDEAARKGMTAEEFADNRAALWKKGLGEWGQQPDRIQRLRDAADAVIYTPGSDAGLPLTVLKSLDAPSPAVLNSLDAMRERVTATASGLCSLLGLDADPIRSREHILLSNILDNAWRAGRNLDMAALIYEIQSPSFKKIGIMDIDQIFPAADRMSLAMTLNNVLASPSFAGWMQGEPLNIQRLLYTPEGKPRLCVLSIAHLSDQERMFFVTILLNELISWMRSQSGTSSLRAILYMDEVFGYLPPTANPPSKLPLLTLLKQARAFGLGLVLATQNPVDLDYKALSNAGTWFLGRLQTERDKLRVLDGLEGASAQAGAHFDRAKMEQILSAVSQRVFLLNNVHEDRPVVFQSRWALSYLSGPMTRDQIRSLMRHRQGTPMAPTAAAAAVGMSSAVALVASVQVAPAAAAVETSRRPLLSNSIEQRFVSISRSVPREARIVYRPALLGTGKLHFTDTKSGVDVWKDVFRVVRADDELSTSPWDAADLLDDQPLHVESAPVNDCGWDDLPSNMTKATTYKSWVSKLKDALYRDSKLIMFYCSTLSQYSQVGQSEGDFRIQLKQQAREQRDLEIEKLRAKYADKIARQEESIRSAEHRVDAEEQQAKDASMSAWVSTGTSILGALFGRKKISATNIGRAGTAARSHSRASQQKADVARAQEKLDVEIAEKDELEDELKQQVDALSEQYDVDTLPIEAREVTPRKSDITVNLVALLWQPWRVDADGTAEPAWDQADT
ncbi:MAG: helicase HerA domain-containing protein [Planctomycetaceae bacterium]